MDIIFLEAVIKTLETLLMRTVSAEMHTPLLAALGVVRSGDSDRYNDDNENRYD